jgi:O-antigen ligase
MKNDLRKPILVLQRILIALMLCYPICAFHLLPGIGDGERYYIRLLLPLALLILGLKLWMHHLNVKPFKELGKAILPWVLTIAVLMAIHHRGGFSSYLVLPLVAMFIFSATDDIDFPETTLYVTSALFCLLIAALQAVDVFYGTFSHWAEEDRGGLGGNPVIFAHTCSFFVGVVLIGLMRAYENKEEIGYTVLYAVAAAAGLYLLYLTKTRGAQLVIFVLMLFMVVKSIRGENKAFSIILFLAIVVVIHYVSQRFMLGVHEIEQFDFQKERGSSWGLRLQMWTVAWQGFLDKPFFGWGPEAMSLIFSEHPELLRWFKGTPTWDFHSDYFNMLATGGILMLTAYVTMMASLAWLARRNIGALWCVANILLLGVSNTAIRGRSVAVSFFLVYLLFLRCREIAKTQKK